MPLRGPTCKMVLARIQFRLKSKLDTSVAKMSGTLSQGFLPRPPSTLCKKILMRNSVMVQLLRLQDFKQGWNSQVGPKIYVLNKWDHLQDTQTSSSFQTNFRHYPETCLTSPRYLAPSDKFFGTSVRRSSGRRSGGRLLAMTLWPLKMTFFFLSVVYFSHRRSAWI